MKSFILTLTVALTLLLLGAASTASAQGSCDPTQYSWDIQAHYPNTSMYTNNYVSGCNENQPSGNQWSTLWFEAQDQWTYKMYNSDPMDPTNSRCNWDLLSWWDDGFLRYFRTFNECTAGTTKEIVYDGGIIFMPRSLPYQVCNGEPVASPWSMQGSTTARYFVNGVEECVGTTDYTNQILGYEETEPGSGQYGIHWRTNQTTTWTSGFVAGSCESTSAYPNNTTQWQEDYWLGVPANTAAPNSSQPGIIRSTGGNMSVSSATWDITFNRWLPLTVWAGNNNGNNPNVECPTAPTVMCGPGTCGPGEICQAGTCVATY